MICSCCDIELRAREGPGPVTVYIRITPLLYSSVLCNLPTFLVSGHEGECARRIKEGDTTRNSGTEP